jgi:hypothetical protein
MERDITSVSNSNFEFKESDPQELTDVQRTWLYSRDPAVTAVKEDRVKDQVTPYDNQMSLPIGEGEYAIKK